MELKDFLNKVVIKTCNGSRCLLHEITAPEICVVTEKPETHGHYSFYSYPTISGDPFTNGYLVFEDERLTKPFMEAYNAYCRTEDAYWETYGYWMRRD